MASFVRSGRWVFAFAGCLLAAGCDSPSSSLARNPDIPISTSKDVLRSGDSLVVALLSVPGASSYNVQVDEQGLISLPLIRSIRAAGLNASDLQQNIRDTYIARKFYTSVDINVSVTERFVYVGGEVAHPGRITWSSDLTVAKAIETAGGFSLYAKATAVVLTRDNHSYTIDVKLAQRTPSEDPRLVPGDSLQVSRSAF